MYAVAEWCILIDFGLLIVWNVSIMVRVCSGLTLIDMFILFNEIICVVVSEWAFKDRPYVWFSLSDMLLYDSWTQVTEPVKDGIKSMTFLGWNLWQNKYLFYHGGSWHTIVVHELSWLTLICSIKSLKTMVDHDIGPWWKTVVPLYKIWFTMVHRSWWYFIVNDSHKSVWFVNK